MMDNGFEDFAGGRGTCLINIQTRHGDLYHCVRNEEVVRFRNALGGTQVNGFWRLKEHRV